VKASRDAGQRVWGSRMALPACGGVVIAQHELLVGSFEIVFICFFYCT
jgi:hypothetical protein